MPDTFTGYFNLTMPEPGGSRDSWGQKLNENTEALDQILHDLSERLAYVEEGSPTGQLAYFALSDVEIAKISTGSDPARYKVKPGWMACRGQGIAVSDYWLEDYPHIQRLVDDLRAKGAPWGTDENGDPRLPDPGGLVIRNVDLGRGRDPDGERALGSTQNDELKQHNHTASSGSAGNHSHSGSTNTTGNHSHSGRTSSDGQHRHDVLRDEGSNNYGVGVRMSTDAQRREWRGGLTSSEGNHSHSFSTNTTGNHSHSFSTNTTGAHTHTVTVDNAGGKETRMKNICFVLCIRV